MNYCHKSGSTKRKIANEKSKKHEELLTKIPKISSMFSANADDKQSKKKNEAETVSSGDIEIPSENIDEVESVSDEDKCDDLDLEIEKLPNESSSCVVSASTSSCDANNEKLQQYSTDAGNWNILGSGINLLQNFWAKQGTIIFLLMLSS